MSINEFLNEYFDPKFQEQLKLVDKVLKDNGTVERLLEWQKQQKEQRMTKEQDIKRLT